jgi:hypothetical protein
MTNTQWTALHINIEVTKIAVVIDVEDMPLRMAMSEVDTLTGLSGFRKTNEAPWPRCFMASNVMTKSVIRNLVLKGFEQGCINHSSQGRPSCSVAPVSVLRVKRSHVLYLWSGSQIFNTIFYPPYSPDLTPSDFSLFPKLEMKLKGRRFQTVEEIQAGRPEHATRKWLSGILQKLVAPLGLLSSLRRGLLWKWCRPLMSKVSLSVF